MGASARFGVFVSYRRDDSAGYAGRLHDSLVDHLDGHQLFMDVDSIEPGSDFVRAIEQALVQCRVVLALIGPRWSEAMTDTGARRLDDPDDYVRRELELAFANDLVVIPVLLRGTAMPAETSLPPSLTRLARCQAFELSDRRWHDAVAELAEPLNRILRDATNDVSPVSVDRPHRSLPSRLQEIVARGACVGRTRELDRLSAAWKQAMTGGRRLALIAGEPGIGKTRLAGELSSRVLETATVAYGWCDEDLNTPYQPWVHIIDALVRSMTEVEVRSTAHLAPELVRLVPEVRARFGDGPSSPSVDADTDRGRLFDAVDALLARLGSLRPLLIVIDDMHWADQPTVALLRRMLRSDRNGSMLVVATYRDTDVDRRHAFGGFLGDVRRSSDVTRIVLRGLDEPGLASLVANRATEDATPEFLRVLHAETQGNPFFAEEILAHLEETNESRAITTADMTVNGVGLPEGVRDVVGRRVSRLSEDAGRLLTVAAVVGRDFDFNTVRTAGDFDADAALDALDEAIRSRLVVEVEGTIGRYAFVHALVRSTLIEELSGPRIARLHWRVGCALAEARAAHAVVAFHLCEGVLAGDPLRAAASAVTAAEDAFDVYALDDARMLAERAVEVLADANVDAPELRCRALLVIGEIASVVPSDYERGRAAIVEVSRLARRHGLTEYACRAAVAHASFAIPGAVDPDRRELALTALELPAPPKWRPVLQAVAGRYYLSEDDRDTAAALIDEALSGLEACDPVGQLAVLRADFQRTEGLPDLVSLTAKTNDIARRAEPLGSALWTELARSAQMSVALRAGDRDGFEREIAALTPLLQRTGDIQADLGRYDTICALLDGRFGDAEQGALELLTKVDPQSNEYLVHAAQLAAAWYFTGRDEELLAALEGMSTQMPGRPLIDLVRTATRARRGERDEVFDRLVDQRFEALPWNADRPGALWSAGIAAGMLGDATAAATLDLLIAPYANQLFVLGPWHTPQLPFEPADSVRGMLLHVLGRLDESIACLESAERFCARARYVPARVSAMHRLATALTERNNPGDEPRARALAEEAMTNAEKLGMPYDARFATMVLERLNVAERHGDRENELE